MGVVGVVGTGIEVGTRGTVGTVGCQELPPVLAGLYPNPNPNSLNSLLSSLSPGSAQGNGAGEHRTQVP